MSDLAVLEQVDHGLMVAREPRDVLIEAQKAAGELKALLDAKPDKVMFGGNQYLEFEDWQTVGAFYGIAPRIIRDSVRPITIGDFTGWEACAEAVHIKSGRVIASADAMCMTDEDKWRSRPRYEYVYLLKSGGVSLEAGRDEIQWETVGDKRRPKKERRRIADEPVPMFQLRSMAQTRAGSKALRNALAWVVVLAGYRATPAEELDSEIARERRGRPALAVSEDGPAPVIDVSAPAAKTTDPDRDIMLGAITAAEDQLGWKAAKRAELWQKYCGHADPRTVDIAALGDLLAALRAMRDEKK